ncbi:MAG TPA: 6,7-dimethyl-8-ribityllumazine synthase [Gemmataceae bacterium]|jgi:6,7-dimethyl-8-ribityllumazine synthase|nr:6,7-dimethyl-8-ribityllumazine synthase [Gemmataceae bacterium]
MATYEGSKSNSDGRFAIVAARFNQDVVDRLVQGAQDGFKSSRVAEDSIDLIWVPGSFEIPLIAQRLAGSGKYTAVVCLGAVIRGDTDHYDFIASEAARGVAQAGLTTGVPVIFGILTCATEEQALDRAGGKEGNKGYDAALAAIEMASLLQKLPGK